MLGGDNPITLTQFVMAWKGDRRDISLGMDRTKYKRGIDEYIYREVDYKIFDRIKRGLGTGMGEFAFPICLFNHDVEIPEWTTKYTL